jgi:Universal stress protein family
VSISSADETVSPRRGTRQGDPADAILNAAEGREADLIVVGNKGMTVIGETITAQKLNVLDEILQKRIVFWRDGSKKRGSGGQAYKSLVEPRLPLPACGKGLKIRRPAGSV